MAERVGHTGVAVANSGYFAELDKAVKAQKGGPEETTLAIENFFSGKTGVDTLIDDLNIAAARGEPIRFSDKMLAAALEQVPGMTKATAAIIFKKAKIIRARKERALASAEQSEQIKNALMARRAENVPKLETAQATYVQRIALARQKYKREGATAIAPTETVEIT